MRKTRRERRSGADLFEQPIRRIIPRAVMSRYAEDCGKQIEKSVNWSDGYRERNAAFLPQIDRLNDPDNRVPHRFATLDGLTADWNEPGKEKTYLANPADTPFDFPIWSEQKSGLMRTEEPGKSGYYFEEFPVYTLDFAGTDRKINEFYVVGDERWNQYPVDFDVILTLAEGIEEAGFSSWENDLPDYEEIRIQPQEIEFGEGKAAIRIRNNASARTLVLLPAALEAVRMEVRILSWNMPGTTAKMVFLSNDLSIFFNADNLLELSIREQKADSSGELRYGISTNSCVMSFVDSEKKYLRNRELLKRNRVLQPYLICQSGSGAAASEAEPLGKFYTDSWEISETGDSVTGTAHDILSLIKSVRLHYPMEPGTDSSGERRPYTMDGTCSERNGNAYEVFAKIFRLINESRGEHGVYGSEIVCRIDERLKNVPMQKVLFGCDTAWNMLNQAANFALCRIYADRNGAVCVERDCIEGESASGEFATFCTATVTPENSFSYRLPVLRRMVVNRAAVSYVRLCEESDVPAERNIYRHELLAVKDRYGNPIKFRAELSFGGIYEWIENVELRRNGGSEMIRPERLSVTCAGLFLEFPYEENLEKIAVTVSGGVLMRPEKHIVAEEHFASRRQNGERTFVCEAGNLITDPKTAAEIARRIVDSYAFGRAFVEAEWNGTPRLEPGMIFNGSFGQDAVSARYECLSNDIVVKKGLRFKTVAALREAVPPHC